MVIIRPCSRHHICVLKISEYYFVRRFFVTDRRKLMKLKFRFTQAEFVAFAELMRGDFFDVTAREFNYPWPHSQLFLHVLEHEKQIVVPYFVWGFEAAETAASVSKEMWDKSFTLTFHLADKVLIYAMNKPSIRIDPIVALPPPKRITTLIESMSNLAVV